MPGAAGGQDAASTGTRPRGCIMLGRAGQRPEQSPRRVLRWPHKQAPLLAFGTSLAGMRFVFWIIDLDSFWQVIKGRGGSEEEPTGPWEAECSSTPPPANFGLSWWGFAGLTGDRDGEAVVWCHWVARLCCGSASQKAFLGVSLALAVLGVSCARGDGIRGPLPACASGPSPCPHGVKVLGQLPACAGAPGPCPHGTRVPSPCLHVFVSLISVPSPGLRVLGSLVPVPIPLGYLGPWSPVHLHCCLWSPSMWHQCPQSPAYVCQGPLSLWHCVPKALGPLPSCAGAPRSPSPVHQGPQSPLTCASIPISMRSGVPCPLPEHTAPCFCSDGVSAPVPACAGVPAPCPHAIGVPSPLPACAGIPCPCSYGSGVPIPYPCMPVVPCCMCSWNLSEGTSAEARCPCCGSGYGLG